MFVQPAMCFEIARTNRLDIVMSFAALWQHSYGNWKFRSFIARLAAGSRANLRTVCKGVWQRHDREKQEYPHGVHHFESGLREIIDNRGHKIGELEAAGWGS